MAKSLNFSEFNRQSPKGILLIYASIFLKLMKMFWILAALAVRYIIKTGNGNLFLIGFVVLLLVILGLSVLYYRNFQFKVDNNSFILNEGILQKTNTTIALEKIQNVTFKQNIIQQIINVYQVNIETAGSSDTEINIKALDYNNALELKKLLSENISSYTQEEQTEKTTDFETSKEPFLKLNEFDLLKSGITENHFKSFFILVGLCFALYERIEDAFKSFGKKEEFEVLFDESSTFLSSISILIFIMVLAFLGTIAASLIRVFFVHYNLTVFVKNNTLEISQGLFEKRSIVLKKEKIQTTTISTSILKKIFGISYVLFKQASSGENKKEKKEQAIRIIGCTKENVSALKELVFGSGQLDEIAKEKSNKYYLNRMFIRASLVLIIFNLMIVFSDESLNFLLINFAVIPTLYFIFKIKYNKRYFRYNDDNMEVGHGIIESHSTLFSFYKIQNIKLRQSIFQKRKDVVDIVFQTAAKKVTIPCIEKQKALDIYNYCLYKVESSKESWM